MSRTYREMAADNVKWDQWRKKQEDFNLRGRLLDSRIIALLFEVERAMERVKHDNV